MKQHELNQLTKSEWFIQRLAREMLKATKTANRLPISSTERDYFVGLTDAYGSSIHKFASIPQNCL